MSSSVIRCGQGHYFDSTRHSACPFCGVGVQVAAGAGAAPPVAAAAVTRAYRDPAPAPPAPGSEGKTRSVFHTPDAVAPVVGWLVCVEGPDKGRDWRLHAEKNFIGRAGNMDVSIAGDEGVSRDKHATVLYDPKKQAFWLLPGDASGLVYRNDEVVTSPLPLAADDVIELGSTRLVLAVFRSARRDWQ